MAYAEKRLGPDRTSAEAYRMKSLLDLGLVLGSDFPVEPSNPFQGLYAAVMRRSPHTGKGCPGQEDHGWHMEEALTLDEALTGFTIGPARAAFMDGRAGIIQDGALADWIVLDEALDSIDASELRKVSVKETWVAGRMVYERQ
jgi:predicted amidohydrolase YtcJ